MIEFESPVDILTLAELKAFREPPWIIQGMFHQQELVLLYGPPSSGKSFVALDWALSVASGIPWLGLHLTNQTPVFYFAGEGAMGLGKRIAAWEEHHRISKEAPVYFQTRALNLRDPDMINEIRHALIEYQDTETGESQLNPGLIVVDTLSQFFGGGDENTNEMTEFVANLRSLSQEENTTVLILHHTNALGSRERGHGSLRGDIDVSFRVEKPKLQGPLTRFALVNDKQRDDKESLALHLQTVFMPSAQSLALTIGKKIIVGARQIVAAQPKPPTLRDLMNTMQPFRYTEIVTAADQRSLGVESTVQRVLKALIDNGEFIKENGEYRKV